MTPIGTALVTGGSKGIGFATALTLARRGWRTIIAARTNKSLSEAVGKAGELGLTLIPVQLDVSDEESITTMFDQLDDIECCVHCAGSNHAELLVKPDRGNVLAHSTATWDRTLKTSLTGTFLVCRGAAVRMVAAKRGGVIVTISSAVWKGSFGQSAYAAAKAGVDALTRTWALELAKYDIRVVGIAPGVVDGNALRAKEAADPRHGSRMAELLRGVPLGRWASEQEVADSVMFAVENKYVTGTTIEIDGGGVPDRRLT